jgi:flagellar protein FlaI
MHAENLDSAVKRLTSKPMEIASSYIPLMNIILSVQRVQLQKQGERRVNRRVLSVDEIAAYEEYRNTFKWKAAEDEQQSYLDDSVILSNISERVGYSKKQLIKEIERRKNVLHWMREQNIRSYKDVAAIIAEYSTRPKEFYEKIYGQEEVEVVAATRRP